MKKILILLASVFLCAACSDVSRIITVVESTQPSRPTPQRPDEPEDEPEVSGINSWTILVYMAADNDLESAALFDINEIESAFPNNGTYSVLALVDRAEGWDGTNGNWTDTRLYEITRDSAGFNGTIISRRLSCPDLDLSRDTQTELSMADPNTLRGFLTFAMREYAAEHYALIIWGHGTGWRSAGTVNAQSRAIAIDDYDNTYMDLPSLKNALAGFTVDIIGFDTCFGATLETTYELSDSAQYFVGSPGIIPTAGWNYAALFSEFTSEKSAGEFCDIIVQSFSQQYAVESAYAISKIYLPAVRTAALRFCEFTQACANTITDMAQRNEIFSLLMNDVQKEFVPVYPSDMFLDTISAVNYLNGYVQNSSLPSETKTSVQTKADTALAAFNACVVQTMRGGISSASISVFFSQLQAPGVCAPSHSSAYVKDSGFINQSSFVKQTSGWTPTHGRIGSLLDKIFYTTF